MANKTMTIAIRDESFPKKPVSEMIMELAGDKLTARDLIRERVQAELDRRFQNKSDIPHQPLVELTPKETLLNEHASKNTQKPAPPSFLDRHIDRALKAFSKNEFLLFVDDTQIEQLEAKLELKTETVITFLHLTPLRGG